MPKSFSFGPAARNFQGLSLASIKDPRVGVRAILGILLLSNIVAAVVLFKPWGGSAEDLERRQADLRRQLAPQQAALAKTKALAEKVQKARSEGDEFMKKNMLDGRTKYSSIIGELEAAATRVGLKPKESTFAKDPIEGSDNLEMMTISANYEGAYPNLTKFINELDRSPRFLIIESLQASPQPLGPAINVNFRLNAFVRDDTGGLP